METDTNNNNDDSSTENEHVTKEDVEDVSSSTQAPILSADLQTPKRSTSKVRLSKAESAQRKAERDAKKIEEEALKAEQKRLKDELKAKKAEEIEREKIRKAEEIQREKERKAEEKARKLEELQQEKARKAEELEKEKARKAEERARREAENANKKAEQMQKNEQKQAAVQKQELVHKQMVNIMDKFVKRIDKPSQKETLTSTSNSSQVSQRCTDTFDQSVSKQDMNFVSDIIENIKSMKKIEMLTNSRPRLNSDSNSCQPVTTCTTTNPYELKTRYIHFPEKYFNRPPYYGTLKKALTLQIDNLQPTASIENIDYAIDSESEWEEPCRDGEELRSDADDLSDPENMDDDSDADSFIVPHGHLSDDEMNEDEQQQSTSTKQAREAAKSQLWDKKVARLNQQRELKPQFGCIYDPNLDEKTKFELTNYFHEFQRIFVPKEILQKEDKDQEITDETTNNKDEKPKKTAKRKSLVSKKGLTNDQQLTAKRTSSVSITVESASPSKRRKMNSNENCSTTEDTDVIMTDVESINPNKINVLEDASNVSDIKSTPLTIISNEEMKSDNPPICTLLIPKRKQPPA